MLSNTHHVRDWFMSCHPSNPMWERHSSGIPKWPLIGSRHQWKKKPSFPHKTPKTTMSVTNTLPQHAPSPSGRKKHMYNNCIQPEKSTEQNRFNIYCFLYAHFFFLIKSCANLNQTLTNSWFPCQFICPERPYSGGALGYICFQHPHGPVFFSLPSFIIVSLDN